LPQSIQTKTTRHNGIRLEVAGEKPMVRQYAKASFNAPLTVFTAFTRHVIDFINHQHQRTGELGIAGAEKAAF